VVAKTVEYATMVREIAPNAEVAGFVGYGYNAFIDLQDAPDKDGKGEFIDYFLAQVASASATATKRLVHYLDVHWYPEWVDHDNDENTPNIRIVTDESTPELVAERVQAPRSLWDSTYVENSWITDDYLGGEAVRLIPWLKERISANYSGTKIAISEWNYGGGNHVSGAIAAADVLGIFGREGVDLAAYVSLSNNDPFVLGAFKSFRNYDGDGAAFGDQSVGATSSDDALASVYASLESGDATAMVLVAINKHDAPVDATIAITHTTQYTSAEVYRIDEGSAVPERADDLTTDDANSFAYQMPAFSVSVIVPKT
jgi:hypothetical protein